MKELTINGNQELVLFHALHLFIGMREKQLRDIEPGDIDEHYYRRDLELAEEITRML